MFNEKKFDPKTADAKQIVDNFNLQYYDKQIEEIKKRIANIRMGKPQFYGIYSHDKHVFTGVDADKKISELERYMARLKDKKVKYAKFMSLARHVDFELDKIAREDSLLRNFNMDIDAVSKVYDPKTSSFDKAELIEKNSKAIIKAKRKDMKPLNKAKRKITSKAYKALKKYAKKINTLHFGSINSLIEQSRFSLDSLYDSLYFEKEMEYRNYRAGIDTELIKYAKNYAASDIHSVTNHYCTGDSYTRYTDLFELVDKVTLSSLYTKAYHIMIKYEEILKRGKDLKSLEYILDAYSKTQVKETESYRNIVEICRAERDKLRKMVADVDAEYERKNLPELIENHKKLEELYRNYLMELRNHRNSKDADYSWSQYIAKANSYRVEMYVIVAKYPELNRFEYKIELENKKKIDETKVAEDHVKFVPEQPGEKVEKKEEVVSTLSEKEETKEVRKTGAKLVTPISLSIPKKLHIEETIDYTDDEVLRKPVEIPDYLSGNVTFYYQQYMKEKLFKTELGMLKFSEYLEKVRPDLKELIEIERHREQRVENIYKKYLKYRVSLEDKTQAMSFKEFAKAKYSLESYEIPQEYDDVVRKK